MRPSFFRGSACAALVVVACGSRTSLPGPEDMVAVPPNDAAVGLQDGAVASATCNHDTCPTGCCEGTGADGMGGVRYCVSGLTRAACGVGGLFCSDCGAMQCVPEGHVGGYCN